jgi:predicted DNA-binding transcriptional regulator YafY
VRLASSIPDTETKQKLSTALDTIFNTTLKDRHRNLEELTEKISVKNIEYSRVNEKLFSIIVNALFNNRSLAIAYYSPHSDKSSQRTILPLHLMQYMGNWHVIAFCALRKDIRDFALSRIKYVSHGEEKINPSVKISSIKEYTRKQFGIIQRGKSVDVRLRFSPSISAWMKEQIWHPEQKVQHKKDGSLIMEFPVADFRELKRRILSYGADVKVIAPKGLAREIQKELDRMNQLYRRK